MTQPQKKTRRQMLEEFVAAKPNDAFARYGLKGASEPLHRYKADEIRTSEAFQTATSGPDVAVRKCEKPNSDAGCSGVAGPGPQMGPNGAGAQELGIPFVFVVLFSVVGGEKFFFVTSLPYVRVRSRPVLAV